MLIDSTKLSSIHSKSIKAFLTIFDVPRIFISSIWVIWHNTFPEVEYLVLIIGVINKSIHEEVNMSWCQVNKKIMDANNIISL